MPKAKKVRCEECREPLEEGEIFTGPFDDLILCETCDTWVYDDPDFYNAGDDGLPDRFREYYDLDDDHD